MYLFWNATILCCYKILWIMRYQHEELRYKTLALKILTATISRLWHGAKLFFAKQMYSIELHCKYYFKARLGTFGHLHRFIFDKVKVFWDCDIILRVNVKSEWVIFSNFVALSEYIDFKGRLSYHLCVECFSQLSFDLEVYTKSAAVADFVYTSESNESCEKHSTQRW